MVSSNTTPSTQCPRRLLWLIGEPGVGKTTLLQAALEGVEGEQQQTPLCHVVYPGGVLLGTLEQGADAIGKNEWEGLLHFLGRTPWLNVVGEGNALAGDDLFAAATLRGWRVQVVQLTAPAPEVCARLAERGDWPEGKVMRTVRRKVAEVAEVWAQGEEVEAVGPIPALAARLRQHPVIGCIRGELQEDYQDHTRQQLHDFEGNAVR